MSDGSGVAEISVHVERPGGTRYTKLPTRSGASWSGTLRSPAAGEHRLALELRDIAGNSSFRAVSPGVTRRSLPLVCW